MWYLNQPMIRKLARPDDSTQWAEEERDLRQGDWIAAVTQFSLILISSWALFLLAWSFFGFVTG